MDENQEQKPNKFDVDFEGSQVALSLDANQDGEKSIVIKIYLSEGIKEAIQRGKKIEDAKIADLRFDGGKLLLSIDTDQDGEKSLEIEANIMEALQEAGVMK